MTSYLSPHFSAFILKCMRIVTLLLILSVTACTHSTKKNVSEKKTEHIQRRVENRRVFDTFQVRAVPQQKTKVNLVKKAVVTKLKEGELYSQLLDFYDKKDQPGFTEKKDLFEAKFPRSSYLDEVYYMSAMMSLSRNNYGDALTHLNTITRYYGTSNKAGAALFAKGIVYKRMNLKPKARDLFIRVQDQFPGSPEAKRAELEIKLLRLR